MGRLRTIGPKVATIDTRRVKPAEKVADGFYSTPEWRALIARLLQERGRRCENPKCRRTDCRIFGDHIKELKDGGQPLDPTNVMLLCGSCHTTKTNEVRRERALQTYG